MEHSAPIIEDLVYKGVSKRYSLSLALHLALLSALYPTWSLWHFSNEPELFSVIFTLWLILRNQLIMLYVNTQNL